MNGLSLFSGGGIGELAFKHIIPGYRTVGYVEWNKYCCQTIEQRIKDGVLNDAPIWNIDIREFNEKIAPGYKGHVDFVSGGFPCQPFSIAGNQLGEADERNMWPATRDTLSIIRPRYAFLENVPNILTHKYIERIFGDLAEIGYDSEWDVVSARFVGAPHRRKRLWVMAHPLDWGLSERSGKGRNESFVRNGKNREASTHNISKAPESSPLADSECVRELQSQECKQDKWRRVSDGSQAGRNYWSVEPDVGRVAHGVANRMERLKMLGNGWVPQVVARILQINEPESP